MGILLGEVHSTILLTAEQLSIWKDRQSVRMNDHSSRDAT
jgi:hypothetical protein